MVESSEYFILAELCALSVFYLFVFSLRLLNEEWFQQTNRIFGPAYLTKNHLKTGHAQINAQDYEN